MKKLTQERHEIEKSGNPDFARLREIREELARQLVTPTTESVAFERMFA